MRLKHYMVFSISGLRTLMFPIHRDRNTQIHATKVYAAEFVNRNARCEASEENNSPQVFVPGSGVQYRSS